MRAWTVGLTCLLVGLVGYAALAKNGTTMPEPPGVQITSPPADLAPELAAFSGVWDATQNEVLPRRLVVEKITSDWATIVYSWADLSTGSSTGARERVRAKVLPGGRLRWGYPGKFTIKVGKDGTSIEGTKEQAGKVATFTMKKVAASVTREPGTAPLEGEILLD